MVWYVKFLSWPKISKTPKERPGTSQIQLTLAITTDLGDSYSPDDASLAVTLPAQNGFRPVQALWKAGSRVLKVAVDLPVTSEKKLQLCVSPAVNKSRIIGHANALASADMPEIVSASVTLDLSGIEEPVTSRGFTFVDGSSLTFEEELGESIARHLWDGGITLSSIIVEASSDHTDKSMIPLALRIRESAPALEMLKVLELGSGCGNPAFTMLQSWPAIDLLLTDLPDAMEILNRNLILAREGLHAKTLQDSRFAKSAVEVNVLDWYDDDLPEYAQRAWDLILISDCTYNTDSIPALAKTLHKLAVLSPSVQILVATKVRHSDEAIFFEHMAAESFKIKDHVRRELPDKTRSKREIPLEAVDIYTFTL